MNAAARDINWFLLNKMQKNATELTTEPSRLMARAKVDGFYQNDAHRVHA